MHLLTAAATAKGMDGQKKLTADTIPAHHVTHKNLLKSTQCIQCISVICSFVSVLIIIGYLSRSSVVLAIDIIRRHIVPHAPVK